MRFCLNPPQRPSQPPQRDHLLFLLFAQDIAHADAGYSPRQNQRPESALPLAGFQVITYGRFWVFTEEHLATSRFQEPHKAPAQSQLIPDNSTNERLQLELEYQELRMSETRRYASEEMPEEEYKALFGEHLKRNKQIFKEHDPCPTPGGYSLSWVIRRRLDTNHRWLLSGPDWPAFASGCVSSV